MAFDDRWNAPYVESRPRRSVRRRRWLETLLLLGFTLCLLIGLGALVAFWRLSAALTPTVRLDDPLASLQLDQIAPALVLSELAGDPAEALAYQALQAGQLESARALITYHSPLGAAPPLGLLLRLAHYYMEVGEEAIAALLFHQARAVALLTESLSSLEQGQALTQIAQGQLEIGAPDAARDSMEQAFYVARWAPDLLPVQRSQLFTGLRPLADRLGDTTLRQQIVEFNRNPFLGVQPVSPPLAQWRDLVIAPLYDDNLTTMIATRQQRARELVNRFAFTGGSDIDPERVALAQALLAEDQARSQFIAQQQQNALTPEQEVGLLLDQRAWLLLKIRIASQSFGLSLVPEWEAARGALLRELSAVTGALDASLNTLAAIQADPIDQASLRHAARQWLALQHELGRYPDSSPEQLGARLVEAQTELAGLGRAEPLRLIYAPSATPPGFRIQPAP
jgi:hypothetical protein